LAFFSVNGCSLAVTVTFPLTYVTKTTQVNLGNKDSVKNMDLNDINESLTKTLTQYAYLWQNQNEKDFLKQNKSIVGNWDALNQDKLEESKLVSVRKAGAVS